MWWPQSLVPIQSPVTQLGLAGCDVDGWVPSSRPPRASAPGAARPYHGVPPGDKTDLGFELSVSYPFVEGRPQKGKAKIIAKRRWETLLAMSTQTTESTPPYPPGLLIRPALSSFMGQRGTVCLWSLSVTVHGEPMAPLLHTSQ